MTGPRLFAIGGVVLALAGTIGTAVVRFASPVPIISAAFGFGWAAMIGYLIQGVTWASVGGLLVVRRQENAVGWLMVPVGVGYALSQVTVSMASSFAAAGTAEGDRLAEIAGWLTVLLQLVTILHFAIGFLFPTGRVQSSRWGRFMWFFWAFAAVFVVASLIQPGPLQLIPALDNPFGVGPDLRGGRPIAPILALAALIIFVSLVISMVSRYRSSGPIERQQLKWFVLALGVSAIGLGIATSESMVNDRPENAIGLTVYVFAGALVPVAIGIAILRYRLYAIDRIISRTIAYAAVTATIGVIFTALLVSLTGLMATVAGGETIAAAASTLAAFALFQPVRRRVQRAIDRRFDRARYNADATVRTFAGRLRDDVDIGAVCREIVDTASAAVRPATAGVWLRERRP
jgi:vacuolar-type H+-ATPase subunit I/STV1